MLDAIDKFLTPGPEVAALADPVFRVLTSLIFIIGGLGHFGQHNQMLARMEESPWRGEVAMIGDPSMLLWLSGAVFVIFGITLAAGFMTRLSALALFVTLVPITIAIHVAPGHVGPLFKNIAILGALLFLWARGGGRFSADQRCLKRRVSGGNLR